ncbi:hypothetical protein O3P69_010523 [Scylla paramamosain]|uniref:Uncharacterized protein n=1 Tax=Scylla paramamosain TaxID=85552 RepID=A0AAW0SD35_SCYPA
MHRHFSDVGHTISVFPYSTCTGQFSPSLRSRRSSQGINTPTVCLSECKARQCDSFLGREELPRVPQWALCRDDAEVARLLQHGLDPGGPSSPSAPTAWRALSLFKPPHTVHGPTQALPLRASPPSTAPFPRPSLRTSSYSLHNKSFLSSHSLARLYLVFFLPSNVPVRRIAKRRRRRQQWQWRWWSRHNSHTDGRTGRSSPLRNNQAKLRGRVQTSISRLWGIACDSSAYRELNVAFQHCSLQWLVSNSIVNVRHHPDGEAHL